MPKRRQPTAVEKMMAVAKDAIIEDVSPREKMLAKAVLLQQEEIERLRSALVDDVFFKKAPR